MMGGLEFAEVVHNTATELLARIEAIEKKLGIEHPPETVFKVKPPPPPKIVVGTRKLRRRG
jgi:hypothetical protein